jgi:hypothetical protein
MTDDSQFEQELAALDPRRLSAELQRRIAEDLAAAPPNDLASPHRLSRTSNLNSYHAPLPVPQRDRARGIWAALVVGGVLAASLVAVIAWRGPGHADEAQPVPTIEASVAAAFDKSSPSLWSYRSALFHSSDSLDDVLTKYDANTLEHKAGGAPALLAARFHSDIDSFLGEL